MTAGTLEPACHPSCRLPETKDSIGPAGKRGLSFLVHLSATRFPVSSLPPVARAMSVCEPGDEYFAGQATQADFGCPKEILTRSRLCRKAKPRLSWAPNGAMKAKA